jgi:hypothetical protein
MKDIKLKINEGKYCRLFSEIQNEVDKRGEYHTFTITDGQKKFKKGFLTFNENSEFFTVTAFNSAKEFAEMLGADEDAYKQYDNVKVGSCIKWGDPDGSISKILRIW